MKRLVLIFLILFLNLSLSANPCRDAFAKKTSSNLSSTTYFIMTRNFSDGTFKSIEDKLSLLKSMGIRQIWISPVEEQTMASIVNTQDGTQSINDHGYWPKEHGKVAMELGGEAALKSLIMKANKMGIKIIIDIVPDHFGYGTRFKVNGREVPITDANIFRNPAGEFDNVPYDKSMELEYSTDENTIRGLLNFITQFKLYSLPALNQMSTEVEKYLIEAFSKYVKLGAKGFRVDAAKHIPVEFSSKLATELSNLTNEDLTFIFEALFIKYPVLDVFMKDLVKGVSAPNAKLFFFDFPLATELRQIEARNDYSFRYFWDFIKYREDGNHDLKRLVPVIEDHDSLTPIKDPFNKKTMHALAEFLSINSSVIMQGTEQTGKVNKSREHIEDVNPQGDAINLINRLNELLSKYRINEKEYFQTQERWIEDNFIVLEKTGPNAQKLFLIVNKGDTSIERTITLPYDIMTNKALIILIEGNPNVQFEIVGKNQIKVSLPPKTFFVSELRSASE